MVRVEVGGSLGPSSRLYPSSSMCDGEGETPFVLETQNLCNLDGLSGFPTNKRGRNVYSCIVVSEPLWVVSVDLDPTSTWR